MEHTISGRVHRMLINGRPCGELALSAGTAGHYGVPIVCVSSDAAGCSEASDLLPGVSTAVVKEGLGRYSGLLLHPDETLPLIEAAAKAGCEKAQALKPWTPNAPLAVTIEFHQSEEADWAARLVGVKRIDAYAVEYVASDWQEMHQAAWSMIFAGGLGASANP
jgi:D-amino peptidase